MEQLNTIYVLKSAFKNVTCQLVSIRYSYSNLSSHQWELLKLSFEQMEALKIESNHWDKTTIGKQTVN